jgi:hypothetical protein
VTLHATLLQALLDGRPGLEPESLPRRVCEVCVDRLTLRAASIALLGGPQTYQSLAAAGPLGSRVGELQFTLGEGPAVEAFRSGKPALEPDLAGAGVTRWPGFASAALPLGVCAVFAVPLQAGGARVGVLDLARETTGPLSADALDEAVVLAEVATTAVLFLQSRAVPGAVGTALAPPGSGRIVVHQATGMVSAQLGVSVAVALARLRAFAHAADRALDEVATEVVARELRFDE